MSYRAKKDTQIEHSRLKIQQLEQTVNQLGSEFYAFYQRGLYMSMDKNDPEFTKLFAIAGMRMGNLIRMSQTNPESSSAQQLHDSQPSTSSSSGHSSIEKQEYVGIPSNSFDFEQVEEMAKQFGDSAIFDASVSITSPPPIDFSSRVISPSPNPLLDYSMAASNSVHTRTSDSNPLGLSPLFQESNKSSSSFQDSQPVDTYYYGVSPEHQQQNIMLPTAMPDIPLRPPTPVAGNDLRKTVEHVVNTISPICKYPSDTIADRIYRAASYNVLQHYLKVDIDYFNRHFPEGFNQGMIIRFLDAMYPNFKFRNLDWEGKILDDSCFPGYLNPLGIEQFLLKEDEKFEEDIFLMSIMGRCRCIGKMPRIDDESLRLTLILARSDL